MDNKILYTAKFTHQFSYMINQKFMKLYALQNPNMKMCTLVGYWFSRSKVKVTRSNLLLCNILVNTRINILQWILTKLGLQDTDTHNVCIHSYHHNITTIKCHTLFTMVHDTLTNGISNKGNAKRGVSPRLKLTIIRTNVYPSHFWERYVVFVLPVHHKSLHVQLLLHFKHCRLTYYHICRCMYFYNNFKCIGGVMVGILAWSAVDRGFKPRSGYKDYKIGIFCLWKETITPSKIVPSNCLNDWLLFDENKLIFNKMMMRSTLY
jgi:hypothetical protein